MQCDKTFPFYFKTLYQGVVLPLPKVSEERLQDHWSSDLVCDQWVENHFARDGSCKELQTYSRNWYVRTSEWA